MKPITLRGFPQEIAHEIDARSRSKRISRNRAVLDLLLEAIGSSGSAPSTRHHDLDQFFGRWTGPEASRFGKQLKSQRRIDPEVWQ